MIGQLTILAVGLAVLVKGADYLVSSSTKIARRLDVSDLVVGLVITAVGTSLPELSSSVAAALSGSPGLVIGNVVGSNIANIGLVLGVAAVVRPFSTAPKMYDRDGFILVGSAALFFALVLDNRIGRLDAATMLVLYLAYVVFAARTDREGVEHRFRNFLAFVVDFEYVRPVAHGLKRRNDAVAPQQPQSHRDTRGVAREAGTAVVALGVVIVGARYVVASASEVAQAVGVPENLIGLSLIAVGTSLPELLVSVSAARQGRAEMIVGNVMGSNIANGLLVIGIAGTIRPLEVSELSVVFTIPIMIFFSLGLLYFIRSEWRVTRRQGLLAVTAYLLFLTTAFIQGWG